MTSRLNSVRTRSRALACISSLVLLTALAAAPTFAVEQAVLDGVVNINTASAEQLQLLPGVGEVRARAILSERKGRGGFKSIDDLLAVKGVGDSLLKRMRPYVTLKGKTTAQRS